MSLVTMERISLKNHPEINERAIQKFIFDDHSFTVKEFLSRKSYEFSGLQSLSVYQNYFCFTYQNTQITIYINDYKTAYNVALELEKHLRQGT